jgi:hypothetical protein
VGSGGVLSVSHLSPRNVLSVERHMAEPNELVRI